MRLVFILWGCEILYMVKLLSWTLMECGLWLARCGQSSALCRAVTVIELYLVPWSLPYFDFMSIWLESRWGQGITKPFLTKALIWHMYAEWQAVTPGDEQKSLKPPVVLTARECWKDPLGQFAGCFRSPGAMGFVSLGSLDLKHKNPPPLFLRLSQFRALIMESVGKVLDPDWRSLQLIFTCVWIPDPRYSSETVTHSPFPSVDCWASSLCLSTHEVANYIFAVK